jgi:hypothetical protein
MEPHFSQTLPPHSKRRPHPRCTKFVSFYWIETLSWKATAPRFIWAERFCVMKSETPQDKRLVGFGDCTVAAAAGLAWSSAFDVIVKLLACI